MPEKPLSPFEQRALPLAALGLKVIPLRGKSPEILGPNWQHQATPDPVRIAELGTRFPDANGGIVACDDYYMWDCDDWSWFAEATQHLPKLDFHGVVRTGSGLGLHIYVKRPKPAWAKTVKNPKYKSKEETPHEKPALLECPLMVVGPGSVHPETKRLYTPMEEPFTGPKDLPREWHEWLQSLYSTSVTTTPTLRNRPLKPGTTLQWLLDSTSLKDKYEMVETADRIFFNYHKLLGRCLIKGAAHHETRNNAQCGFFCMKNDPTDFGHKCFAASCERVEGGQRKAALAALGITLEDVLRPRWRDKLKNKAELDQRPLGFVVDRFVPEEGITGIGGQSGHGKTYIMLSMAKAISTGERLWGILDVKQHPVIYMLAEGGDRALNERLDELKIEVSEDFLVRTMSMGPTLALDDPDLMEAVFGRVVFLDTLPRWLAGRDENKSTEMAELFQLGLDMISKGKAVAVVMAQHSIKPGAKTPFSMTQESVFRGSGDIVANLAAAHGVFQLDNQARDQTLIHLECVKPRDFEPLLPFQLEGKPWIDATGDFRCVKEPGSCGWFKAERKEFVDGTKDQSPDDKKFYQALRLEKEGKTHLQIADILNYKHRESVSRLLKRGKRKLAKQAAAEAEEDVDQCSSTFFPSDNDDFAE